MAYGRKRGRYGSAMGVAKGLYNTYKTYTKLRSRFKKVGYPAKSTKGKGVKDLEGVTTQHDRKVQYVRKPMPKYKKKRWAKFVKKVRAVEVSERGLQTCVINSSNTINASAGAQEWSECHLYSRNGGGPTAKDLAIGVLGNLYLRPDSIATGSTSGAQYTDAGTIGDLVGKNAVEVLFQSATMDVTWTNSGETAIEGDLYLVCYRKGQNSVAANFREALDNSFGETGPPFTSYRLISGGSGDLADFGANIYNAPNMNRTQRGVTLFDVGMLSSKFGVKILKKEKLFIPSGASISKNMRDPKNHKIVSNTIKSGYNFTYEGLTMSYIVCWKSIASAGTVSLVQKVTRSYRYTIEGVKSTTGTYITDNT